MITSKQRAYLRGLANPLESIFQVGKGGINEHFVTQIDETLTVRELIKIKVLETSPIKAREVCDELCKILSAEPVQIIGSKLVIYRQNKKLDEFIKLPR